MLILVGAESFVPSVLEPGDFGSGTTGSDTTLPALPFTCMSFVTGKKCTETFHVAIRTRFSRRCD